MALPKEGIRDSGDPIIISMAPDVCLTPVGSSVVPIPYSIYALASDDVSYAKTVRFTGQWAMLLRSHTSCCYGDAPGTKKGIKSGTVGDICEPLDHSRTVRIEGSPVIRNGDRFYMNKRNTLGQIYFTRNMETYQVAQAATGTMTDASPAPGSGTRSLPKLSPKGGSVNLWKSIVDGITGGALTQAQIENVLAELDYYADTPGKGLSADNMDMLADAAEAIRTGPMIAGDLDGAKAIRDAAWDNIAAHERQEGADEAREKERSLTRDNVRISANGREVEICFDKPKGADQKEFERQLKEQQDELNNMSPEQYQANRGRYLNQKRGPDDAKARRNARKGHQSQRQKQLERQFMRQGLSQKEALAQAAAQTRAEMASLDALHALDAVAGGDPTKIIRLGDSRINRAIGSQWKTKVQKLDEYAKNIKGKQAKMKVRLTEC